MVSSLCRFSAPPPRGGRVHGQARLREVVHLLGEKRAHRVPVLPCPFSSVVSVGLLDRTRPRTSPSSSPRCSRSRQTHPGESPFPARGVCSPYRHSTSDARLRTRMKLRTGCLRYFPFSSSFPVFQMVGDAPRAPWTLRGTQSSRRPALREAWVRKCALVPSGQLGRPWGRRPRQMLEIALLPVRVGGRHSLLSFRLAVTPHPPQRRQMTTPL